MKTRALRTLLGSLICLALLATFSTSSAQAPASPVPPVELPWFARGSTLPLHAGSSVQTVSQPGSLGIGSNEQADGLRIRLAVGEFDPLADPEPARVSGDLRLSAYPGDGTGYYLVQFGGPIASSDVDTLTAAGAEVFDYIPDFTFIVKMDNATRTTVEQMEQIRWVGLHQPAYRLPPDLLAKTSGSAPIADYSMPDDGRQTADLRAPWGDSPIEVVVTIFRGEELMPIVAQIESMGGVILDQSQTQWKSKLRISVSPSSLTDMAAISGVRWIEEAPKWKLTNNESVDIMGVREVWDTHGLYGAGQTIAVCDTGLDQGSTSPGFLHDDFEDGSGSSRVVTIHELAGDGDASDENSGHGTHVAGSVLGNGDLSGATPGTHTYPDTTYAGVAPEASLVFQAVEDNTNPGDLIGIPLDLNTLFAQAASSGATLHTNSWGGSVAGMYTSDSRDVDEYVWDHKDFTILFVAGNEGIDSDADGVVDLYSMDTPATAKNCITVGATENNRPSGSTPTPGYNFAWGTGSWAVQYPSPPVSTDHVSDAPTGLAAFSSRGPALDGRIKPDLVAPGTNIASVRSSVASGTGWGAIDANYMFMGGTSMATPLAAGAATLVRQYYVDGEGITPSAALIKATLVNGATDIYPGQYGTGSDQEIPDTRPTNVAGWGRVNLERSIFPTATRVMTYTDVAPGLGTGEIDTYSHIIGDSAEPFRVTLAWSDYPGSPAAAGGLVNDLDLKVTGPGGATYYPNNASQRGASQQLAYDDGVDNGAYSWSAGIRVAVRFTPTSYPATLQTGLFLVGSESSSYPKTFTWYVYDGDTSGPDTVLASGSTTIRRLGWHPVDLSGENVTISSGDFFLAIELPDGDLVWLYDNTFPDGRSWDYDGSWSVWNAEDYMFNAIVKSADASTSQDRINNLVGIDVESPATGVYTVTVSAYNIPMGGSQPYALVASGAITTTPPPPAPDVNINKRIIGSDLWPGAPVTFTLAIANSGTLSATAVVVTDVVPSEVSPLTYASTLAITATGAVSYVWNVESLDVGASGVITIYGQINPGLGSNFFFVNTATISALGDNTPSNNISSVTIGSGIQVYLPIVMKRWPPIPYAPVLYDIDDPAPGSNDYTVRWSHDHSDITVDNYTLQEANNQQFTQGVQNYTIPHTGTENEKSFTDKPGGTYYYRVQGHNEYGTGAWSNVESVSVRPPDTLYSVGDALVMEGRPTTNFGDTSDMWVGYDDYLDPDGKIVRSLIQFDASVIPTGTSIDSAILQVYLVESWDYPGKTRTLTTYRIGSAWSESSVSWNTRPPDVESYGSTGVTHGSWGWYSFDVTNLVRGWVNGTLPNYGVMLRGPERSGSNSSWKSFSTREGPYTPRLIITYSGYTASANAGLSNESPSTGQPVGAVIEVLIHRPNADFLSTSLCRPYSPAGKKCLALCLNDPACANPRQ